MSTTTVPSLTTLGIKNYYHQITSTALSAANAQRAKRCVSRLLLGDGSTDDGVHHAMHHEVVDERVDGEAIDMAESFLDKGSCVLFDKLNIWWIDVKEQFLCTAHYVT